MPSVAYCPKCKVEIRADFYGSYRCPKCQIIFSWFDDPINIEAARIDYYHKPKKNVNLSERIY